MTTIVHLTNVHPSNDVRIFVKECKSLAKAGYRVVLIASLAEGHCSEEVELIHFPKPRGRISRMLGSLNILRLALHQKGELYHFHDPELIPVGILLKFLGKRVIYDVHENVRLSLLSREYIRASIRLPLSWMVRLVEKLGGFLFDAMVVATPSIGKQFSQKKVLLLQNFPLLGELNVLESTPYQERPQQVCYLGWISRHRGAYEMLEAAQLIAKERGSFKLVFGGDTQEEALRSYLLNSSQTQGVQFLGYVNRKEAQKLLDSSRVGLVIFHPEPNHLESQPNKLFEYMIAGIPVVASHFPLWKELLGPIQSGLLVDPLKPLEIKDAIEYLLDHPEEARAMGERGKKFVMENCHWDREVEGLLNLYQKILGKTY